MPDDIIIREDFRALIPPLSEEELNRLRISLEADGCLHPLIVWKGENVLIDGHHRYEHCRAKGIDFDIRYRSFSSEDAARNWMILHQLGRRNLDPKQASILRGRLYNGRKKDEHDGGKGKPRSGAQSDPHSTAEAVAKQTGVSPATVKRDAKFATAIDTIEKMVGDGTISTEERAALLEKPKAVIQAVAAGKATIDSAIAPSSENEKPKQEKPKVTAYMKVVNAFKKLKRADQEKALKAIDEIWNNQ